MSKSKKVHFEKKSSRSSSLMSMITLVTLLVLFAGLGVYSLVQSDGKPDAKTQTVQNMNYAGHPKLGSDSAPVKLMEFGDFKCPTCKMFHDFIFPQLKKEYIDTGKVQMFFTNLQFIGPDSVTAGEAGESVFHQKPEAFWAFYDAVYTHQGKETETWATPAFLADLVKKYVPGVDVNRLQQDLKNKTYEAEVKKDGDYASSLNVTAVPAIFINGKKVENGMDYQAIKQMIEQELKKK
jgi:protein-disulfide isomerase